MTIYLLADRRRPAPPDETAYPGLKLYPVEADGQAAVLAGIRRITPAAFIYDVRPDRYCGCYFFYETPEMFAEQMAEREAEPNVEYANTPEQAEAMWRCQTNAVRSFGRYLSAHADAALAVYVVWEGRAGQKGPARAAVPPSYFDGPGFKSLPEDLLLTIIPESDGGEKWPWDSAAPRTHEWLSCARECSASDLDGSGGRAPAEGG
ncbi:MAG TPA: hypothetical protein VG013_00580 [Gemmataceae bacterium]|nr:hypothetical protein [Gemmataceae bacterium]